jgi:hypothetical protein
VGDSNSVSLVHAAAAGAIGLALTFMGYRLMRVAVRVFAGLFLALAAYLVAAQTQEPWLIAGVSIAAGVVGFLIGDAFYWLFIALFGAAAGSALAAGVCQSSGVEHPHVGILLAAAAAGVVLAVLLQRPFYIFATAANGAMAAAAGLHGVLVATGVHGPQAFGPGYLVLFLGLLVAGCFVQAKTTKNLPDPKKPDSGAPAHA